MLFICRLISVDSTMATYFASTFMLYLFPVFWIVYNFKKHDSSIKMVIKPVKIKITEIASITLLPEFLSYGVLFLLVAIISYFSPTIDEAAASISINLFSSFVSVVIAPFCEEIIFRGFLLNKILIRQTAKKAILTSSLVFGILHFESFISATIIGFVLCVIYMKYKSLFPCILSHALHNTLLFLFNYSTNNTVSTPSTEIPEPTIILILAVVMIAAGTLWLIRFLKKNIRYITEYNISDIT